MSSSNLDSSGKTNSQDTVSGVNQSTDDDNDGRAHDSSGHNSSSSVLQACGPTKAKSELSVKLV